MFTIFVLLLANAKLFLDDYIPSIETVLHNLLNRRINASED